MFKDHTRETKTGFSHTSPDIDLGLAPNQTASVISSSSTTIQRIRGWAEHNQAIFRFPDEGSLLCAFTNKPISENDSIVFVRCKKGDAKSTRIVMCFASCRPDKGRYEVLLIKKGGFNTFKTAVGNMTSVDIPIDRSLYY